MMYITGDCHGNFERFNASIFPEQNEMTKDDYVIFLSPRENYNLDKGRDYIEKFSLKCKTNHIKNIYWEELVDITIQKISKIPELYEYYINFKHKYFED